MFSFSAQLIKGWVFSSTLFDLLWPVCERLALFFAGMTRSLPRHNKTNLIRRHTDIEGKKNPQMPPRISSRTNPNADPLSHTGSLWYLPGQTTRSGTLPGDDVQAAVIQTDFVWLTVSVLPYMAGWGSTSCPTLFPPDCSPVREQQWQSMQYSTVLNLPCRTAIITMERTKGTSLWFACTQSSQKCLRGINFKAASYLHRLMMAIFH